MPTRGDAFRSARLTVPAIRTHGGRIKIAFLNQNFLVQRETVAALRRLPGASVAAIDIVSHPSAAQAREVTALLERHGCGVLVTINEWGMDAEGVLRDDLAENNIVHCNWSVDDPFYEEIMLQKKFRPSAFRFDFVSDEGYIEPMRRRGYKASFLPLAVDPAYFYPDSRGGDRRWEHDIVFVGNSYLRQMDDMLQPFPGFVDTLAPFLGDIVRRYIENMEYDVEGHIHTAIGQTSLPDELSREKACFIAKHAAGYFGRKQIIGALVKKYPGFKVFGETGWLREIPPERLGVAKYYDSLCPVYRGAKITIDINRMVIRNGFTQRAFDVPASGGFLLTSAKPAVHALFETAPPLQEVAVFRSLKELEARIDYFLDHEEERLAIARRGMKKVLAHHTYDHRIQEMFAVVSGEFRRNGNGNGLSPGQASLVWPIATPP